MKKTLLPGLFAAVLFLPSAAFAQFPKGSARASLNKVRLERALKRATATPKIPRYWGITVPVSRALVPGGQLVVSPVLSPVRETVANASLVKTMEPLVGWFEEINVTRSEVARIIAISWQRTPGEFPQGNKVFYQDQSVLARDLHQFYGGKGPVFRSPAGKLVKMYALPVNGILYQPQGYAQPVVLNTNEYFVVYDIQTATGQLTENKSAIYKTFRPVK